MKYFYHSLLLWVALSFPSMAFAQAANCLEKTASTYENGILALQSEKKYDANNRLISQKDTYIKKESGSYSTEKQLTYTPTGKIATTTLFLNNALTKKITNLYDAKGGFLSEVTENANGDKSTTSMTATGEKVATNANGTLLGKEATTTTTDGKPLKQTIYGADGKAVSSVEMQYNAQGKVSQKTQNDLLAGNERKTTFSYDTQGNLTQEVILNNGKPFMKTVNEYDANGNLTKQTGVNSSNQEEYVIQKTYSVEGKLQSESYFSSNELISKKVSTYDTTGNKLREDYLERGKLVHYTEWTYSCK